MENLIRGLPASVKQTLVAIMPLFVVTVLFVFVGNFGIGKISDLRGKITQAENDQATLTQKLGLLRTLSATAATSISAVTSALPDTNSSLSVISQLKSVALLNGVALTSIKSNIGPTSGSGLNEADVSFNADGTRAQLITFLDSISGISPITVLDKVKLLESAGTDRAGVNVKSFWVSLPKTIPAVTQPITDLSSAEKATLTKISGLIQPTFNQVAPSEGGINQNPFGQ